MVITSLNLYDFSEQTNREMGVLATWQDDIEVIKEAMGEVLRILSVATPKDLRKKKGDKSSEKVAKIVQPTSSEAKEGLRPLLKRPRRSLSSPFRKGRLRGI